MTSLTRKTTLLISILLLTFSSTHAVGQQGMSEEQMQRMMQQAAAAQKCFEKFDQSQFDQLQAKGEKMQAEIKALCAAGKRDEAMSTAMDYGIEMSSDPTIQEMRKCGEMMQDMMANMPKPFMPPTPEDLENQHICDDM